jgi:hypothetical protein
VEETARRARRGRRCRGDARRELRARLERDDEGTGEPASHSENAAQPREKRRAVTRCLDQSLPSSFSGRRTARRAHRRARRGGRGSSRVCRDGGLRYVSRAIRALPRHAPRSSLRPRRPHRPLPRSAPRPVRDARSVPRCAKRLFRVSD